MKSLRNFLLVIFFLFGSGLILPQSFEYISPKDNSILVSLSTNIILRSNSYVDPSSLSQNEILVVGSISGKHPGKVTLSDDSKTILFFPSVPFLPDEDITVNVSHSIKTTNGNTLPSKEIHFRTTPLAHPLNPDKFTESENNFVNNKPNSGNMYTPGNYSPATDTLPPNFPFVTVGINNNPAPGKIFMTNQLASNLNDSIGNYLMILNNDGSVANYKELPGPANIFRMQPNGELSYSLRRDTYWTLLDTSLAPVDSFSCGNGYITNIHDFYLLPNGHGLVFSYDPEPVDMSKIVPGGNPNAIVTGAVIQEVDEDNNVVFQWRTWDYIPITESYVNLTNKNIDYIHMNSVSVDNDGNIIASMRHLSSVIKINRETGNIMWILGGKQNEFTFINEHPENAPTYFSYQHDATILPNGNITLFDNGNQHPTQRSRGVEYELDQQNKTATLVWEYRHNPDIYTFAMGTCQRLPNGNTIIGWGYTTGSGIPTFTEVHPDNSIALEMSLPEGQISHRSYKYPWVSQLPAASVTKEILQSNTYTFNSNTDTTGITITFNQLQGGGYVFATVTRYNYAPVNPIFTTDAPNAVSNYFTIEGSGITSYTGDVVVNLNNYPAVLDPKETIVYARPDGNTAFTSVPTSYDSTMNELTFTTSNLGEFIFGVPQVVDSSYAPFPITPKDSEYVNGLAPVELMWGTRGIVQTYHLQVATDPSFSNLIVDNSNLTSTIYNLNSVNNDAIYYWRVNNTNSAGTSSWSTVNKFYTTSPFISMIFPNGGENIYLDSTYIIRWQTNLNDTVNIELFKDGNFNSIIADTIAAGTHAINWTVSTGISVDSSYKIKVSSIKDPTIFGMSNSTFNILSNLNGVADNKVKLNSFDLYQNYPNPFNPSTIIKYSVPEESRVKIKIFNIVGQQVAELVDAFKNPGSYKIKWNAKNFSSGVYFYSIKATGNSGKKYFSVKKMIYLK